MPKVVGNKSGDRMGLIWILENASPERTVGRFARDSGVNIDFEGSIANRPSA
jgi:hypothetical protein